MNTLTANLVDKLEMILKQNAGKQVEKYPQYNGHFDDYQVVIIKKEIKTKLGKVFDALEYTIAKPEIRQFKDIVGKQRESITAWSFKTGTDTSISKDAVIVIGSPFQVKIELY